MAKKKEAAVPPKLATAEEIRDKIRKTHGNSAVMELHKGGVVDRVEAIPTGSIGLDLATGIGGYPRGRVVEMYGPEASGKTTLCLHAIANVQRAGGLAAFVDAEHALDTGYAGDVGVDMSNLVFSQPDHGEQALDVVETLCRSGAIHLVVVDSVAALTPKAEIEGSMEDNHVGRQARLMGQGLRKLVSAANATKTTILFTNQLRMKIGVLFGSPETTPGGNALKFYASMRMDIRRRAQIKTDGDPVGNETMVKVIKNKHAPPFRNAEFEILWGHGIDSVGDVLKVAEANGIVQLKGAWFSYKDERLGQGFMNARKCLADAPALLQAVDAEVRGLLP